MAETDDTTNEDEFLRRILAGDDEAFREFWNRYGRPLQKLAKSKLGSGLQHRIDAEDLVQSVCRTFFRRATDGQFTLDDAESLWRLLCVITVIKAREKQRFHLRQRRDVNQERSLDSDSGAQLKVPSNNADDLPPDEVVALAEQLENTLQRLDEEERQILDFKLQAYDNAEIAERLGCSSRTVRRLTQNIRTRLEREFNF